MDGTGKLGLERCPRLSHSTAFPNRAAPAARSLRVEARPPMGSRWLPPTPPAGRAGRRSEGTLSNDAARRARGRVWGRPPTRQALTGRLSGREGSPRRLRPGSRPGPLARPPAALCNCSPALPAKLGLLLPGAPGPTPNRLISSRSWGGLGGVSPTSILLFGSLGLRFSSSRPAGGWKDQLGARGACGFSADADSIVPLSRAPRPHGPALGSPPRPRSEGAGGTGTDPSRSWGGPWWLPCQCHP